MLTQLTTVKARLGVADGTRDEILTRVIEAISARFDHETGRLLERRTDHLQEFAADWLSVPLDIYPVERVVGFKMRTGGTQADLVDVPITVTYTLRQRCVLELAAPVGVKDTIAAVVYDGGYVPPGGTVGPGQERLPPDIEFAAIEQIAFWHQRKDMVGLSRYGISGTYYDNVADMDLLPAVRSILARHRRLWL